MGNGDHEANLKLLKYKNQKANVGSVQYSANIHFENVLSMVGIQVENSRLSRRQERGTIKPYYMYLAQSKHNEDVVFVIVPIR